MSERSIAPGLLLAMPQLPDPNFSRSVVLMVDHNPEGSWGMVLNRPSELPIREVLDQLEVDWRGDPDAVVWQGGPVEPLRGCLLHEPLAEGIDPEPRLIVEGIALSTAPNQLEVLAARPPVRLRFLLGYAGWGALQLEHELAEGSWLLAPASAELVFATPAADLWEAAIQSLGIDPSSLVPATGVH